MSTPATREMVEAGRGGGDSSYEYFTFFNRQGTERRENITTVSPGGTPCIYCADDRARRFPSHRTPCSCSAHDRARKMLPHRTPCMHSVHDRARISVTHRTPCTESADDRARRMQTHRTPCTVCADDRAHRFLHHRTPCIYNADDRADKRCTPCSSSATSPRARMALLLEGLSSASCPSSSTHRSASRRQRHRRYPELESSRVAATLSSSLPRAP